MGRRLAALGIVLLTLGQLGAYVPQLPPAVIASCGTGCAIDWSVNSYYVVDSTSAATTLSFTAPPFHGVSLILELCQDGAGGHTVTWPATVFDGGAPASRIDAIFPLQPSACGVVQLSYDGVSYYIVGKPDLIANCSHSATLSGGTQTAANLCCNAVNNVFVCNDVTTPANACHARCAGVGAITLTGTGTDNVIWERLW